MLCDIFTRDHPIRWIGWASYLVALGIVLSGAGYPAIFSAWNENRLEPMPPYFFPAAYYFWIGTFAFGSKWYYGRIVRLAWKRRAKKGRSKAISKVKKVRKDYRFAMWTLPVAFAVPLIQDAIVRIYG